MVLERVDLGDGGNLREAAERFVPDVVHLLHAYRTGLPWLASHLADRFPFVVTLTGTDVHGGLDHPVAGPVIREILERAGAVITQNRLTAAALTGSGAGFAGRVRYLTQGIVLGRAPCPDLREGWVPSGVPLLLHPASIRPVKGNLGLLRLLDPLAEAGLGFALGLCGPVLDEDYGRRLLDAAASRPWARHLGVIAPAAMAAALAQADVVLNNSQSEGLSNALAEAAALGRPILARDIPGNAAVVDTGVNGLLYSDPSTFAEHAAALILDPTLRRRLSVPCLDRFDPGKETRELEAIYREATGRER